MSQQALNKTQLQQRLIKLYQELDRDAQQLHDYHANRLHCARGCHACCVDEITVFEIEADNIRANHSQLLNAGTAHAPGMCAFLDQEGGCRIYPDRPYVCRTQGLPLRWLDEIDDEVVELRDICPLNDTEADEPIEELLEDECWTIGPFEERLAKLQLAGESGALKRVSLRSLFQKRS